MNDKERVQELSSSLQSSKINHTNEESSSSFESQKVFKKASSNQMLTLYLGSREVELEKDPPSVISGVVYIDPKAIEMIQKVYCQLTLTFRYGREDEEVMGLKFCNEVIIALHQIWPPLSAERNLSSLQETLIERLGFNAIPFTIVIDKEIPASVQLLPAKRYSGSPIGTSYDVRVYAVSSNDIIDDKIQKRFTVRLGVRLIHKLHAESEFSKRDLHFDSNNQSTLPCIRMKLLSPKARKLIKRTSLLLQRANSSVEKNPENEEKSDDVDASLKGPSIQMEKPFLWTEGRIILKASLSKKIYTHGENVKVSIELRNDTKKIVRKIRIFIVQFVDVCMFSNGKFKNIIAEVDRNEIINPTQLFYSTYSLLPQRGSTKNWIAVEGALFSSSNHDSSLEALHSKLASSTPQNAIFLPSKYHQEKKLAYTQRRPLCHQTISHTKEEETTSGSGYFGNFSEKNVFAINVSYYAKIKLSFSSIGGDISLKLPFFLGNIEQTKVGKDQKNSKDTDENCEAVGKAQKETEYQLGNISTLNKKQSSDSSVSDIELKHENVVRAQIHERKKYLESDM